MIYSAQVFALTLIAADDTDAYVFAAANGICRTIPTGMQRHTRESAQVSIHMTEHIH
jgi:hypothetical protein